MTAIVKPKILSAPELMALDLPDPRWAVVDVIPEGMSILAGRPKSGKSWLMLGVGVAVASGGRALGRVAVQEGDVLMLALEDSEKRLQQRLEIVLAGSAPPPRLDIAREWARGESGVAQLDAWLKEHPQARLVIIDTLAKFRARANHERGYSDDYADLEPLQQLAIKYQVAVVVVHHQRKLPADDWLDTLSGTLGLVGAADGLLGLIRVRGESQAVLKVTGRDLDEHELGLRFDPDSCSWTVLGPADVTVGLSQEAQDVVAVLSHLSHPAKARAIANELGKPYNTIRKRLQRMVAEGLVTSSGMGFSLPVHVVSQVSQ
jgi:hypothetical protein